MNRSELEKLIGPYGIRPIRGRGQNFLLDENVVLAMADAAGVGPGSRIVEIGPGPGILTAELLARGAEVVAVELDKKLCALLAGRFRDPRFRLVEGDALEIGNAELAERFSGSGGGVGTYQVVANLPYSITSAALEKFLFEEPKPSSVTVMIQREVADRILAEPGGMSSLAVAAQALAVPRRVVDVPRQAFYPSPEVDSAVIHMAVRSTGELKIFFKSARPELFFKLVRTAFASRRKQLGNSLGSFVGDTQKLKKALFEAKIEPTQRPEELTVQAWVDLAGALEK